jgi:hypothetical protein
VIGGIKVYSSVQFSGFGCQVSGVSASASLGGKFDRIRNWMFAFLFDAGRSMFDVGRSPFHPMFNVQSPHCSDRAAFHMSDAKLIVDY